MKCSVFFFSRLYSSVDPDLQKLREGNDQRKFIVLRSEGALAIVVGPVCYDHAYYHRQLLGMSRSVLPGADIAGGGYFRMEQRENALPVAVFYSSSGDYGKYDSALRESSAVAEFSAALGVSEIRFE